MLSDGFKKMLVATVSAVALITAFTPMTANAFNVAVHTSGTAAYAAKKNGGSGGAESKFLKQCTAEVAKAENTQEFSGSKFGYHFNASQIKRVEDCVDARLEAEKPTVSEQWTAAAIGIGVVGSISFGLSWVFGGGLDNFSRGRYIARLKKGTDEDTQNAIDRIAYEEMSTSHRYDVPSLSEKFFREIRKPEPDIAMIKGYSKIHGVDKEFSGSWRISQSLATTPLNVAIGYRKPDVVRALVEAGAKVNTAIDGLLPLDYAIKQMEINMRNADRGAEIIRILTDAGAISIIEPKREEEAVQKRAVSSHGQTQFQNMTAGKPRLFRPK